MPMALPRVANTTSDIPAMLALPANERPDTTATVGTHPDISAMPSNVPTSLAIAAAEEPGAAQALGPGAATVGEAHEREPVADRQVHDAVDLGVVDAGLRAAPHRVVVRRDGDALAVQRAEPGDEAAGRLVLGAGEHAGLDERAGVDDGVDALAGGQPAPLVDLGDRLRAGIVVGPRPLGAQLLDRLVVQRTTSSPGPAARSTSRRRRAARRSRRRRGRAGRAGPRRCAGRTTAPGAR